jgi:hypothetical protein
MLLNAEHDRFSTQYIGLPTIDRSYCVETSKPRTAITPLTCVSPSPVLPNLPFAALQLRPSAAHDPAHVPPLSTISTPPCSPNPLLQQTYSSPNLSHYFPAHLLSCTHAAGARVSPLVRVERFLHAPLSSSPQITHAAAARVSLPYALPPMHPTQPLPVVFVTRCLCTYFKIF